MSGKFIYTPTEVLTYNKLNKLIVLPFGKMLQPKIPFRYKGKWFRRTSKTNYTCHEVEIILETKEKNMIVCDYHDCKSITQWWIYRETLMNDDLIGVFSEFLNASEQKYAASTINLHNFNEFSSVP